MEVVYIYMKDYLGLKEKEYNFHENYKFYFDKKLKEISMKETEIKIPEIFFGEKINSINAIIGENGKGKTRILDFIYKYSNNYRNFIKFKKENLFEINKNINKSCEADFIIILKGKENELYINSNLLEKGKKQNLVGVKTFYYSNIFDYDHVFKQRDRKFGRKKYDLSITEEFLRISPKKYNINSIFINIKIQNDIKQINLIKDLKVKYNEFYEILKQELYLPENIVLDFLWFENTKMNTKFQVELNKEYMKIYDGFESESISSLAKELFKRFFIINMWGIITGEEINLEKEKDFKNENLHILEKLDAILNFANIKKSKDKLYFLLDINYANDLLEIIKEIENKIQNKSKFKFKFKIDLRKIPLEMRRVIDYSWENAMSSGEKGLLRLFSYLHEVLHTDEELENLVLLIDELDATFHPEWQRKALDLLVKYLNNYSKYIKSNLTSQLIISSHSPFLIADLPKEKIIALDNIGNQKENKELTAFGANILDIYKENFFLTSTFGEFAKGKITNVIELLSKGENEYIKLSEDKKNEIKFIINSVGEPLIKNKLKKMYLDLKKENQIQEIKRIMKEKGIDLEDLREEGIQ